MKQWILRVVLTTAFLFALVAISGAVSSPQAYAASTHTSKSSSLITPDINRVTCGSRTDWFRVYNNTGELCFANAGFTTVYITRVSTVCSGNNAGYFIDAQGVHHFFDTWGCYSYNNLVINAIDIN